jgi:hypothetical protein
MIEVLIEENYLKRYEDIRLTDISLLPTEIDLWSGDLNCPSILQRVG